MKIKAVRRSLVAEFTLNVVEGLLDMTVDSRLRGNDILD